MAKFAIELFNTFGITSRDIGVEVDVTKLSPEIVAKLALHGLTQKVGDSAAGALKEAGFEGRKFKDLSDDEKAKVNKVAKDTMLETIENLYKGEWAERRAGASVDPVTQRIRVLFGALLREQAKDVWATIKDLEAADKAAKLDELFAGQDDEIRADIEGNAKAQLEAEAKAKAKLGKVQIKVNL
jgi:hypothetical protein